MHDTLSGIRPLPALICYKMDASVHRTVKSVGRLHLDSRIMGNIIVTGLLNCMKNHGDVPA